MQGTVHLCIEPPLRSAPFRSASLRAALLRSAPLRSAALRAAPAPLRCAPRRASARRPARLRSAPLRSAPTPLRSTPLRCGTICSELFSFPEAARPRKKLELSCRCHWLLFMMLVCVLSSPRRRCRRSWHVSVSLCGDCRVVGGTRTRALQGCARMVCVGAGVPAVRVIARCCVCVV